VKVTINPEENNEQEFDANRLSKLRDSMQNWLRETPKPCKSDIRVFVSGLQELLEEDNLEHVNNILLDLRKYTEQNKKNWLAAFNTILEQIQNTMKHKYSGILKIKYL